jgi:hypothetical protein
MWTQQDFQRINIKNNLTLVMSLNKVGEAAVGNYRICLTLEILHQPLDNRFL